MELPFDIWNLILSEYINFNSHVDNGKQRFLELLLVDKAFNIALMHYYDTLLLGPYIYFRATMICTAVCECCGKTFNTKLNQLSFMNDEAPQRVIIYCNSMWCFKMALYSQRDAIHRQAGLLYDIKHVVNYKSIIDYHEGKKILIDRSNGSQTLSFVVTRYLYIHKRTGGNYMLCKWYEGMEYYYKLVKIDKYLKHHVSIKLSSY